MAIDLHFSMALDKRSLRDPRVHALHESGTKLHAELEAEGADYC
jgi:hypothetical protein